MDFQRILIVTISCFLFFRYSSAQSGFIKAFDEQQSDVAVFLDVTHFNDTLVFYGIMPDTALNYGVGFIKIDTFGNVLSKKLIIDPDTTWTSNDWSRKKIIQTNDNNLAIIGNAMGRPFFMKVDKDLNLTSHKHYQSNGLFIGNASLTEDGTGFLLACHIIQPNNTLANDILIIKTDNLGNEIWRKQFGNYEYSESPGDIVKVNDNEFVIAGSLGDYPGFDDPSWPQSTWGAPFMLAIDSTGEELWTWVGDTSLFTGALFNIVPLTDGGWMTSAYSWENTFKGQHTETYAGRPAIMRLSRDLDVVWMKVFGFLGHFHAFQDINQTKDGNFLASGFLSFTDDRRPQGVHYKFTPEGDSLWLRLDTIYPNSHTRVQATEILSSGSIMSIGYAQFGPFGQTGFIMKLSPDGCMDTLNCFPYSAVENVIFEADALNIYPNPATDQIIIQLPENVFGANQIIIRDIQGRTVHEERITTQEITFNSSLLSSGQYFIQINYSKGKVFGKFLKL